MALFLQWLNRVKERQVVRPWALCAPVVVLVIALPMLRPLRSPGRISENEASRFATIQALVEHDTLAINNTDSFATLKVIGSDQQLAGGPYAEGRAGAVQATRSAPWSVPPGTIRVHERFYSDKPPVLSFLLSWPYQLMHRMGWDFEKNPALVAYVLTMLGVTLPVAGAAGLIYRMGRLFELRRPLRTALALSVVLGSGLIGYATALNPHAPAAALLIAAFAALLHVANAKVPTSNGAWLVIAGMCASLAAVIDLSAVVFLALLLPVILAMRWNWALRISGVVLFGVGATPPIILHVLLTVPVTGDLLPGFLHPELTRGDAPMMLSTTSPGSGDEGDEAARPAAWKMAVWRALDRTLGALVGSKGLLLHWPIVILGLLGMLMVLRKHWPATTKLLATGTLAGSIAIIAVYAFSNADWTQSMLGPRWFIVFMPLALFWSGAWLRRSHRRWSWAGAGFLLVFSTAVSLLGALAPFPRTSPGQYSVAAAIKQLSIGDRPQSRPTAQASMASPEPGD